MNECVKTVCVSMQENIMVEEVKLRRKYLNSGDVFIFDLGLHLIQVYSILALNLTHMYIQTDPSRTTLYTYTYCPITCIYNNFYTHYTHTLHLCIFSTFTHCTYHTHTHYTLFPYIHPHTHTHTHTHTRTHTHSGMAKSPTKMKELKQQNSCYQSK